MMVSAQDTWAALLCEVDEFGHRLWRDENGKLHRDDGPAVIHPIGTRCWFKHGVLHREDGPAVIRPNGRVEYWLDDRYFAEQEFNARKNKC